MFATPQKPLPHLVHKIVVCAVWRTNAISCRSSALFGLVWLHVNNFSASCCTATFGYVCVYPLRWVQSSPKFPYHSDSSLIEQCIIKHNQFSSSARIFMKFHKYNLGPQNFTKIKSECPLSRCCTDTKLWAPTFHNPYFYCRGIDLHKQISSAWYSFLGLYLYALIGHLGARMPYAVLKAY